MSLKLSKFEKTIVFAVFIAVAGILVGSAYVFSTFIPSKETATAATDSASDEPANDVEVLFPRSQMPATQPASPLNLVAVPTAAALPPVAVKTVDWQAIENVSPATRPATQPAMVIQSAPPADVAITLPSNKPVAAVISSPTTNSAVLETPVDTITSVPAPIKPYAIALPASRVTHMYASEIGQQPTWYELKLDSPQMAELATAANAIATVEHQEADEFDRLAVACPRPDLTLPWWRPSELIDPNLLVIAGQSGTELWIAMSRRTGRTFLYAFKPVDFTAAR